ncbi:Eco57I restriction-modification methylase domain-containing protein [Tamlana crocina]|uniref:site-specific DNA-methyltransferase (adenine-specific) n=1 Tax=Tamlana crocina TaxID=393006 RepID=A0ABX1D6H4_9FLAO|nr:DNA methyltransferase [Tamlana crocina]NJX13945.1 hypothetical protein [Tamlana crocina]
MGLFQNSVLNKYLKGLDAEKVNDAYQQFIAHFHNPTIQENIRNSKEEQYQGEFLIDLFVNVLGYTKNPTPDFNLTTELKNIKGSKKTDGAILSREHAPLAKALAVIELKGTNTTDLSKVETQAFGYKNNQPGCNYVITSNFEKLRFYIDNAVDFEEFNLFQLSKERFDILYLCLSAEYVLKDIPKQIKNESLTQEENVTKKLYKDYASFRNEIFNSIQAENPEYDKLTLFKKTQKLLDRFLFIFFAEDRLLLPPNSIRSILQQWTDLKDKYDEYFPLYNRFQKYFGYMNTGHKGQKHDIFAYNGGLFAPDEILDNISVDDDLLYKHTLNLSNYDFETEVSVNILGHIFEHSLNDIDEIQAEIQGTTTEQSKTKRKKDGVFYTPKYITKYIVDNTVGKLCEEKKAELNIQEAEYEKERKGRQKATIKKLNKKLEDYRNWLLKITICDPACGSGAFLNQALEFLIAEHQYIDELQAKLFGDAMVLSEVENAILENNLFGVDINEESVEIAKLSLWLRTAQKGRKLTSLNHNIKCGNSLIDDPEMVGDKAFSWQKEFPGIFKEKDKKAYHITTALHDSRTSQRMIDYKVREKRDGGTNPLPNYTKLTPEEELTITNEIIAIAEAKKLNIMAYNVCGDHIHLLLVCEEAEVPKIMQEIKGKTARTVNIARGVTTAKPEALDATKEHAPSNKVATREHVPSSKVVTREHAPLPIRGKKQNSLWTQKFGTVNIKDDAQLQNTIAYIQNNREKHGLPISKKLQLQVNNPILNQSYDAVFAPEYAGGFDVVIGNPPYVKLETIKEASQQLEKLNYQTFDKRGDLYVLFVEKGFNILKQNGIISYIMPNKWLQAGYGKKLRAYFLTKQLHELIDFGDIQIFQGATTYPIIFTAINNKPKEQFNVAVLKSANASNFETNVQLSSETFSTKKFNDSTWVISSQNDSALLERLNGEFTSLNEFVGGNANYGIKTGLTKAFLISREDKDRLIKEDPKAEEVIYPFLQGRDVTRYAKPYAKNHLILFEKGTTKKQIGDKTEVEAWEWFQKSYKSIANWLLPFEEKGKKRTDKGDFWWELRACDYYTDFQKPKIMYQTFQVKPCFVYDEKGLYCNNSMWIIPTDNKSLLGILNSKMGWWLITKYCTQIQNGYQLIWKYFGQIPVPNVWHNHPLAEKVSQIIELKSEFEQHLYSIPEFLFVKYGFDKLSRKLENWHELEFAPFLKELKKLKIELTLSEESQWMDYFKMKKEEAQELQNKINKTESEIDQMVYELYGLTDEEIAIVEEATT